MSAAAPLVWVVASHRELVNPAQHRQLYTVMDEAGQRTMLNMGLQPVCYPRVPPQRASARRQARSAARQPSRLTAIR